jgi:hypothetical protein
MAENYRMAEMPIAPYTGPFPQGVNSEING